MSSSNIIPLHVFIDQEEIIGKTKCKQINSNIILTKEKNIVGITMSFVLPVYFPYL
jgi:hypothetical protein